MKIAIIGSGLAGLACAERLVADHHTVRLFDKGRGPGGRMSTRRMESSAGEVSFDHGAQYFTAREPSFRAAVEQWSKQGIVEPWPAAGNDAWVGVPAMNAPIKALAKQHDVTWSTKIDPLLPVGGDWQLNADGALINDIFDAVVVAVPAEQVGSLIAPVEQSFADIAAVTVSAPCWTLMLAFAEELNAREVIYRDDPVIGWAARNSDKPGRTATETWVIQASPAWSVEHLEDSQESIVDALSERFAELSGSALPSPIIASAHRWRYARSGGTKHKALYNEQKNIGVCGDWLIGPRVECAWSSGEALAAMMSA